jgi:Flp pilus assembly protein TadG
MIDRFQRHQRRRGAAAIELAAVLPPILGLLLGIWEVGRVIEIQQLLTNAAREGARQASTGTLTSAQVQQVVKDYLATNGVPTTNANVVVADITKPGTDPTAATYMDQFQITVYLPFSDVRWTLVSYFVDPAFQLSGQVQWMTMVDKAFPDPADPPIG